jgi:hypothetical protein
MYTPVEQTTTVSHVLDGGHRTIGNLQWAIHADLSAPQVGLEERRHLSVARPGVGEHGKVNGEAEEVD